MTHAKTRFLSALLLTLAGFSACWAEPASGPQPDPVPTKQVRLGFQRLAPQGTLALRSLIKQVNLDFGVRSDQLVTAANLHLVYTLSPALLPVLSQLKIYLNDELMGTLTVQKGQSGQPISQDLPLDPRLITDFNRLRFELVGHYDALCEDPSHSSLWANISKQSAIQLTVQQLPLRDDLSQLPEPFFDPRDNSKLDLPLVFAATPDLTTQTAAAILTSWFGMHAAWRGYDFPVLYDRLPDRHAVVFATNRLRPAFLSDYPAVKGPTLAIIGRPDNPYVKLLLVLGRDEQDLLTATRALALGSVILRGQTANVDRVTRLAARQPYDAPRWIRTDKPVLFKELLDYDQQLQVSGLMPSPVILNMNVPPDLFTWRSQGIPLQLKYRYTPPTIADQSRLSVSINDQFVQAFNLRDSGQGGRVQRVNLPILNGLFSDGDELLIPALKIGSRNQLRFDFSFASYDSGATTKNSLCQQHLPVDTRASIDPDSSIDFSGYYHYMALPDLRAFANVGYPFTRMADLSQTQVLMPAHPSETQLSLLFNLMGLMGETTGYPAVAVSLTADPAQLRDADKDILAIGQLPAAPDALQDELGGMVAAASSWIASPLRDTRKDVPHPEERQDPYRRADSRVSISAQGPLAVIAGFPSPFAAQRSVVALMASAPQDYQLINDGLGDEARVAQMSGSVVVLRNSGISSQRVGDIYYVGNLPWWMLLWYHLSNHPVWLATFAMLTVVLLALVLWNSLRWHARRRLQGRDE